MHYRICAGRRNRALLQNQNLNDPLPIQPTYATATTAATTAATNAATNAATTTVTTTAATNATTNATATLRTTPTATATTTATTNRVTTRAMTNLASALQPLPLPPPPPPPPLLPVPVPVPPPAPVPLQYYCGSNLRDYGVEPHSSLDLFLALSDQPVTTLFRRQHAAKAEFTQAVEQICTAYLQHPSEQLLFRLLALPKLGIHKKISTCRARLTLLTNIHTPANTIIEMFNNNHHNRPAPIVEEEDNHRAPHSVPVRDIHRIGKSIAKGHIRKGAQILRRDSSVANPTPDVVEQMVQKHPQGPDQPFADHLGQPPAALNEQFLPTLDLLVRSLDLQTSPGISGWTPELIQLCYRSPTLNSPFRRFMFQLANQLLHGTAPGQLLLCSSRLTALQQGPTKLRPVACGELFYRLLTKFLLRIFPQPRALLPCQLGVGSPAGVDPVIELVNQAYRDGDHAHDYYAYSIDMSNAFNCISRTTIATSLREHAPNLFRVAKWAYNTPTPLVMSNRTVLKSSQGVRQGDPLGPLLFSIGLRPQLTGLQERLPAQTAIAAYLDDIVIISTDNNLMDTIYEAFPDNHPSKLRLNRDKTYCTRLRDLAEEGHQGMPILGSLIGNTVARQHFLDAQVTKTVTNLKRLRHLPAQEALLLLRLCIAPELSHLLRTLQCDDILPSLTAFDEEVYKLVNYLRIAPHDHPPDAIAARIMSLPLSRGGLGLFSTVEMQPIARRAATFAAQQRLLAMNLPAQLRPHQPPPPPQPQQPPDIRIEPPPTQKKLTDEHFTQVIHTLMEQLNTHDRLIFTDNMSKIGTAWLHAIPTRPDHIMSSSEIAAAINIRLLAKGTRLATHCRCTAPMDLIHPELCREQPLPAVNRHNSVVLSIANALRPSYWVQTEPTLLNQPNARRADIRIGNAAVGAALHPTYGHIDIKIKCIQANNTNIVRDNLVRAEDESITTYTYRQLQAVLDATHQQTINEYANLQLHPPVVPIVISSGGTLHPTSVQFLKSMFGDPDQRKQLRTRISIVLLRSRAMVFPWPTPVAE